MDWRSWIDLLVSERDWVGRCIVFACIFMDKVLCGMLAVSLQCLFPYGILPSVSSKIHSKYDCFAVVYIGGDLLERNIHFIIGFSLRFDTNRCCFCVDLNGKFLDIPNTPKSDQK
eukprot:171039_1